MGDIFDEMFGTTRKKSKKSDPFSLGDIGFDAFGSGGLFGNDSPKIFKIKGKQFVQDPRNPEKLVRLKKKKDNDIFGFGGDMFGIGDIGDQKGDVSILGNKRQMRETQESIDIIKSDARRAGGAIRKGARSLSTKIRRPPRIDRTGSLSTRKIKDSNITFDDAGSTADDKEYCFQATKGPSSTVRCFRNSQIALRVREDYVSRGFNVTEIDEKIRR